MISFNYYKHDINFVFRQKSKVISTLNLLAKDYKLSSLFVSVVFTNDSELLKINKERLSHDYLTDIITFDFSSSTLNIEGELFISIDRVVENSAAFLVSFSEELCRVIIHGVLHLLGKKDSTREEKKQMHSLENKYLLSVFHMKRGVGLENVFM